MAFLDETDVLGSKFGKITILSFSKRFKGNIFYNCQCDCGAIWEVTRSALIGKGYKKTRQCMRCRILEAKKLRKTKFLIYTTMRHKRLYRSSHTIDGTTRKSQFE